MLWAPSFQGPRSTWVSTFFFFFFFFCVACRFFPPWGGCRIYQTGGGGAAPSIGPRALETLATPLMKVFVLYDPPHLLKSMRNNLKKHGFTIEAEDKVDIMWDHIVSFYETDSSKPVRLAPKLTRCHIDIPPFKDLRVHLAAQVMSHSVATGMAFMAQWNIIPGGLKIIQKEQGAFCLLHYSRHKLFCLYTTVLVINTKIYVFVKTEHLVIYKLYKFLKML